MSARRCQFHRTNRRRDVHIAPTRAKSFKLLEANLIPLATRRQEEAEAENEKKPRKMLTNTSAASEREENSPESIIIAQDRPPIQPHRAINQSSSCLVVDQERLSACLSSRFSPCSRLPLRHTRFDDEASTQRRGPAEEYSTSRSRNGMKRAYSSPFQSSLCRYLCLTPKS